MPCRSKPPSPHSGSSPKEKVFTVAAILNLEHAHGQGILRGIAHAAHEEPKVRLLRFSHTRLQARAWLASLPADALIVKVSTAAEATFLEADGRPVIDVGAECAQHGLALHFAHNFAIGYCIKKIWTPRRVGAGWYIPSPRTLYTRARDTRSQDDRRICVSDNRRVERCWSRLHPTRVFFDPASRASASHSHASKTRAAGRPGTARPNRPSSMIRQAITASRAMARSSVAASWC